MSPSERQSAIETALENGQHEAAGALVKADARLSEIDALVAAGPGEPARIQAVINHAMPTQSEPNRLILVSHSAAVDPLPAYLRSVATSIRNNGGGTEASVLDRAAALIASGPHFPPAAQAMELRLRISAILDKQTNAEVRRWFLMALSPGSPVVTNTGERIA